MTRRRWSCLACKLIKDEVQYYKDIYKEQGIKGLIESL